MLTVFAKVTRCKDVMRGSTRLGVFNKLLHLLGEYHTAFEHEFGVTRHRVIEVARDVVGVGDVVIAVIYGEVVNVAEMSDFD